MSDYTYHFDDSAIDKFNAILENRIGDSSGFHEQDFFDTLNVLLAAKEQGACLDVGAGVGRVTEMAKGKISELVALEPDESRWQDCHKHYHDAKSCVVLCQTTGQYIQENPGKTFDLVVVSMVIQHLSTDTCANLLADVKTLLAQGGIAIISTTHTLEECKGFSFSGDPQRVYVERDEFDRYANMPTSEQTTGLPVRRFSQADLQNAVKTAGLTEILWRQISYYKPNGAAFFAQRLGVTAEQLKDVGNSQYVVVRAD